MGINNEIFWRLKKVYIITIMTWWLQNVQNLIINTYKGHLTDLGNIAVTIGQAYILIVNSTLLWNYA